MALERLRDTDICETLKAIKRSAEKNAKKYLIAGVCEDMDAAFTLVCEIEDRDLCWKWNWWVRERATAALSLAGITGKERDRLMQIVRKTYLLGARRECFDDYCVWLEIDRPEELRFYTNRRASLLPAVRSLQDLYDGKIKFLGLSMPPRVGKSTLCFLFLSFVFGHRPHTRSLCVGYSTTLVKRFFERILDFIEGEEYRWSDVFPKLQGVTKKSVEDMCFDVKPKPTAFPTCICRGIDGSLTGDCDCSEGGIQYCDDLVRDYEESLNPNRLEMLWGKYVNQVRDRMHGSMQLMVGTRWNVLDPLGRLREIYEDYPEYRFLIIPALNEKDESNFAYKYDGFSTADYRETRRITGEAEWWAKYQGQPFNRDGIIFEAPALRTYNGVLPETPPDNIIAAVDVALGGGDNIAMPVGYVYGSDIYIADVLYNNGTPSITAPLVAACIAKHEPYTTQFEENSGGKLYKDLVEDILNEKGLRLHLTTQRAKGEQPKRTRILVNSDFILSHCVFLDPNKRTHEYRQFMRELCTYTAKSLGRNKHDDAPDALAQLVDLADLAGGPKKQNKVRVMSRWF